MNKGWEDTVSLNRRAWVKPLFRVAIPNSLGTVLEMFSYYFINSMSTDIPARLYERERAGKMYVHSMPEPFRNA